MAIFMFDIDETLLAIEDRLEVIQKSIPRKLSKFSPYRALGYDGHDDQHPDMSCYTLNKEKMTPIFQKILQEGHKIGFVTAGQIKKDGIREFIKFEYGIVLDDFIHYRRASDKAVVLNEIAKANQCLPKDIYLIDDNLVNIRLVYMQGFSTIHVDTCTDSITSGVYITQLESTLEELEIDDLFEELNEQFYEEPNEESNEEKVLFAPDKALKFPLEELQMDDPFEKLYKELNEESNDEPNEEKELLTPEKALKFSPIILESEKGNVQVEAKLAELRSESVKASCNANALFQVNTAKIKAVNLAKNFTDCLRHCSRSRKA